MSACHQQSNLFRRGNFRIDLADNASLVKDQQTIGQRCDFFEFG